MIHKYAPDGTFTVATFSSITTETGGFIMSPGEVVPPPDHYQGPCPTTQVVIIEYATKPRALGWLEGHELFLHLESSEFEQLKRAIMNRGSEHPAVTITWTNRENGFLNQRQIKGGAPPSAPSVESEEPTTVTRARRSFRASKALAGQKR